MMKVTFYFFFCFATFFLISQQRHVCKRSLGLESRSPLIVEISSTRLIFISLLLLSRPCPIGNISQSTLVLAVGEDLLSAQVLLLLSPKPLRFLLLLFRHFSLAHLHLTLVHDLASLLCVETLEMVRLHSVRSQH